MKTIMKEYLSDIRVGITQEYKNMSVLPILSNHRQKADYSTLREGLKNGFINVTENEQGATISDVSVLNTGEHPVILVQGEEIEGAMQNRVFNTTMLIGAKSRTTIPVSCTEAGRWSYGSGHYNYRPTYRRSDVESDLYGHTDLESDLSDNYRERYQELEEDGLSPHSIERILRREGIEREAGSKNTKRSFKDSGVVMPPFLRKTMEESVSKNLMFTDSFRTDQRAVWSDIERFSFQAHVRSETSAIKDVFSKKKTSLSDYLSAFHLIPGQQGVMVYVNGEIKGFEMFSRIDAYKDCHDKLLKGYAMEAVVAEKKESHNQNDLEHEAFIKKIAACEGKEHESVGLGSDYRLNSNELVGSALVLEDEVIHLNMFPRTK